ncbi:hypothetical protein AWC31_12395 [Mycolicibacterium wolinskyi]|uniref:Uncharacterized protein n=1 Tax=Mycolicibacterium wolinskyi TaxID=59750 RepID=A0A1X2FK32_9MYCO|nr:hypothetical protein AWC31_12395 [Mycolicibacterium wolinskyi]
MAVRARRPTSAERHNDELPAFTPPPVGCILGAGEPSRTATHGRPEHCGAKACDGGIAGRDSVTGHGFAISRVGYDRF